MKTPWAIDLYNSLNVKQKQRFKAFLESPYFNGNSKLTDAFQCFLDHTNSPLEGIKRKIHQCLHPKQDYDDVKVRLFFSEIAALLRKFLWVEEGSQNEAEITLNLIRHLRRTQRIKSFERIASHFKKALRENNRWNPSKFSYMHQMEMEVLSYESFKNRFTHFDFKDCTDHLEIAGLIQRLRIYLEQLSQEAIGRAVQMEAQSAQWFAQALQLDWNHIPELKVYVLAIQLFKQPGDESTFFDYLDCLNRYEQDFEFEFGRELYVTALNYGIRKINQNRQDFFKVTLDLFQHCILRGWILDYGVMSSLTYKNIIVLCIRMQDLELASTLLERYKPMVDQRDRIMIYQFCSAKIMKEKGQYQQALYLLNTSLFKDPLIELNARVEMIKIHYEIDELEWMNNQLLATKNLIRRTKKIGYHKDYYSNFLSMAGWLMHCLSIDQKTKEKKLLEIQEDKKLIEKSWLYQMVLKIPVQTKPKLAAIR